MHRRGDEAEQVNAAVARHSGAGGRDNAAEQDAAPRQARVPVNRHRTGCSGGARQQQPECGEHDEAQPDRERVGAAEEDEHVGGLRRRHTVQRRADPRELHKQLTEAHDDKCRRRDGGQRPEDLQERVLPVVERPRPARGHARHEAREETDGQSDREEQQRVADALREDHPVLDEDPEHLLRRREVRSRQRRRLCRRELPDQEPESGREQPRDSSREPPPMARRGARPREGDAVGNGPGERNDTADCPRQRRRLDHNICAVRQRNRRGGKRRPAQDARDHEPMLHGLRLVRLREPQLDLGARRARGASISHGDPRLGALGARALVWCWSTGRMRPVRAMDRDGHAVLTSSGGGRRTRGRRGWPRRPTP